MEKTTHKGTLSDAINKVSTIDIIEFYNVPHQARRGKIYILCPNPDHNDMHYGSCYVDKDDDGYYCYPCGAHVNKWNMVLQLNGNKKADAYAWFFQMAGMSPIEEKQHDDPYKKALRAIRRVEQYMRNGVIYNDVCACDKIDSSYGRNINGEYLYSEISIANPLMELYKSDKAAFKHTVDLRLNSEMQKLKKQMHLYKQNPDDGVYVDGVGLISNLELANACDAVLSELDAIKTAVFQL